LSTVLRTIDVVPARLPKQGQHILGKASPDECVAIAQDMHISKVEKLNWDLVAKPWRKSGFQLIGRVSGTIEQPCVVTLAPVIETIDEAIDLRFLPAEQPRKQPEQTKAEPRLNDIAFNDIRMNISADEDEPETWTGDTVDVMSFVIEHLALGINPYPRAEGADAAGSQVDVQNDVNLGVDSPNKSPEPEAEPSALARALLKWGEKRRD
jgi:hypothetical protein